MFEKLKKLMRNFSIEEMKSFLGNDIVDSLFEWTDSKELTFTKHKLVEMIMTVHQSNILKSNNFRELVAANFTHAEILSFRQLLSIKYKNSEDLKAIVKEVSAQPWKRGKISSLFLSLIELDESVFDVEKMDSISKTTLSAHEKFYELLDYQYIIRQRVLNELASDNPLNRMLIQMPTGTGKTKTATHIISHHYCFNLEKKGLVIWLAHTTELLQQAFDTFVNVWKHIGKKDINLYKLWGQYSIEDCHELEGVMICGIQKLQSIKERNPELHEKLVRSCRLIVFDEAHKAAACETRKLVDGFMIKKEGMHDRALIGLTATPGRSTQESFDNDLLANMFSGKLITIDTKVINQVSLSPIQALNMAVEHDIIKYLQKRRVLSKVIKEELEYEEHLTEMEIKSIKVQTTSHGYDDFSEKVLETIGKKKSRNLAILNKLKFLHQEKVPTIVFACSVKHAQLLSSFLSIANIPNAIVIGNMSPQDRINAIRSFKDENNPIKILINFEVLTTGFDSTNIRCVFITRPTQSVVLYSQMLGRGLRGPQMGGNENCLLIDLKDNLEKYNENLAFKHFNNYWNT